MTKKPVKQAKNKGRPEPPKAHRWKKGQSGNPKGRPTKDKALTDIAKKYMNEKCYIKVGNIEPGTKTWKEMVVLGWLIQMVKGNSKSLEMFLDRTEGKLPTTIDLGENMKVTFYLPENLRDGSDSGS